MNPFDIKFKDPSEFKTYLILNKYDYNRPEDLDISVGDTVFFFKQVLGFRYLDPTELKEIDMPNFKEGLCDVQVNLIRDNLLVRIILHADYSHGEAYINYIFAGNDNKLETKNLVGLEGINKTLEYLALHYQEHTS